MSSGNKALDLQMQMRQNTEDLQNFMRDLNSWEADIRKKDEQLRTGNAEESSVWIFFFYFALFLRLAVIPVCYV